MSLPYFPLYPSDFEAKTSHLTIEEDGAYNRLLRLMWMTPGCSLPNDHEWIARRMRVDQETYDRVVRRVLDEFFSVKRGRIVNKKLAEIAKETAVAHSKRVKAGSAGGKAKALKENKKTSSNAKAMPQQPEPEPVKEEPNGSSKKRGSRLREDWVLPKSWGEWAVEEGLPEDAVRKEAARFKDWWLSVSGQKGVKRDWLATWRNWIRKAIDDRASGSAPKVSRFPSKFDAPKKPHWQVMQEREEMERRLAEMNRGTGT